MTTTLLLGAGCTRNWGGWLAPEVLEHLLGRPEIDPTSGMSCGNIVASAVVAAQLPRRGGRLNVLGRRYNRHFSTQVRAPTLAGLGANKA